MTPKHILLFLLILCSFEIGHAQQKKADKTPKDSLKMYRNIENYSQKRGFTKFLHRLIFEPVVAKSKIKKNTFQKIKKKGYAEAEGKIIRKINIVTLDPFGYSVIDSTKKPNRWSYKTGNAVHNKTKEFAIRNLLLIKKNRPLDSLKVLESQRLIRSQRFVRAIDIYTKAPSKNSDSVDVYIRVLDSWSLIPNFSISSSKYDVDLNERNFLGFGHQFRNRYRHSYTTGESGFSTLYSVPNIMNTYIQTSVSYDIDVDQNYSKFLKIERPFYSPLTRWAGGIYLEERFTQTPQIDSLGVIQRFDVMKYETQDYWAGHAYPIFKGSSEKSRTTNLITSARYFDIKYDRTPESDTVAFFSNQKMYMMSFGISSRQFIQDKYLFNYAVVEDVPVGIVYGVTGGYQQKNDRNRYYFGARFAYGRYFKIGYMSTSIDYGSFYYKGSPEQSSIVYKFTYFTNLLETTRWKFRQFVKPALVIGNQRVNTNADRLTLNGDTGLQGFETELYGTKKLLLSLQTQGYSPWLFWGFRMNPYLNATFGMLGNAENGLRSSKVYSQFGAGIIITNDYLVFGSFQLSFSYYPTIPLVGDNVIKTNAYRSTDFELDGFDISKPELVPYQ